MVPPKDGQQRASGQARVLELRRNRLSFVEGVGSYGAGLARFVSSRGFTVVEVNRPDRVTRYRKGKSDSTGAKDSAVKARTQAFNQMKALIVTSSAQLREFLSGRATAALVSVYRGFRPGGPGQPPHRSGQACPSFSGPPLPSTRQ